MTSREAARSVLEERLGRRFSDPALLERALTHSSVGDGSAPVDRRRRRDNERLEFLGDRVLGLLTAELLVASAPGASEGDLAVRLNALVNREACARAARRMELGAALRLSPAESRAGGREKDSILADACEAVMAALYLDGGLEAARAAHRRFWADELERADEAGKDPKTLLQERVQGSGRPAPVYEILSREGPDHAPTFTVAVRVEGVEPATATGASRQAAEKAAARKLLEGAFSR